MWKVKRTTNPGSLVPPQASLNSCFDQRGATGNLDQGGLHPTWTPLASMPSGSHRTASPLAKGLHDSPGPHTAQLTVPTYFSFFSKEWRTAPTQVGSTGTVNISKQTLRSKVITSGFQIVFLPYLGSPHIHSLQGNRVWLSRNTAFPGSGRWSPFEMQNTPGSSEGL